MKAAITALALMLVQAPTPPPPPEPIHIIHRAVVKCDGNLYTIKKIEFREKDPGFGKFTFWTLESDPESDTYRIKPFLPPELVLVPMEGTKPSKPLREGKILTCELFLQNVGVYPGRTEKSKLKKVKGTVPR